MKKHYKIIIVLSIVCLVIWGLATSGNYLDGNFMNTNAKFVGKAAYYGEVHCVDNIGFDFYDENYSKIKWVSMKELCEVIL